MKKTDLITVPYNKAYNFTQRGLPFHGGFTGLGFAMFVACLPGGFLEKFFLGWLPAAITVFAALGKATLASTRTPKNPYSQDMTEEEILQDIDDRLTDGVITALIEQNYYFTEQNGSCESNLYKYQCLNISDPTGANPVQISGDTDDSRRNQKHRMQKKILRELYEASFRYSPEQHIAAITETALNFAGFFGSLLLFGVFQEKDVLVSTSNKLFLALAFVIPIGIIATVLSLKKFNDTLDSYSKNASWPDILHRMTHLIEQAENKVEKCPTLQ